jgi:hypothetical protein
LVWFRSDAPLSDNEFAHTILRTYVGWLTIWNGPLPPIVGLEVLIRSVRKKPGICKIYDTVRKEGQAVKILLKWNFELSVNMI